MKNADSESDDLTLKYFSLSDDEIIQVKMININSVLDSFLFTVFSLKCLLSMDFLQKIVTKLMLFPINQGVNPSYAHTFEKLNKV